MIYEDIIVSGSINISGSFTVPIQANSSSALQVEGSIYHDNTDTTLKIYSGSTFTDVATQPVTPPATADIEYLVVAGGGAGGGTAGINGNGGGGGGAGGLLSASLSSIKVGTTINVTVGAAGAGSTYGAGEGSNSSIASTAGSSFTTVTSTGGGGGGQEFDGAAGAYTKTAAGEPGDGGSGGGGATNAGNNSIESAGSGTSGQGNDGGISTYATLGYNSAGGGGGAGAAGQDGPGGGYNNTHAGDGGDGKQSSITGTSTYYAGGGGGGGYYTSAASSGGQGGGANGGAQSSTPPNGTANTGGGGGGRNNWNNDGGGGNGGSGVVILAYNSGSVHGAGGIKGDAGNGRRYHQFNSSDTFEVGGTSDFNIDTDNLNILWDAGDFASRGTSTWTDLSGNSRNGTVSGATLGSNYYYTFDGSNDHIYNGYHKPAGAQSLIIWFRFAGNGSNGYSLSGFQQGSGRYFYIGRQNSGNRPYYYAGNNGGAITTETISNNTWVMLSVTIDGSNNVEVYQNATSIATATTTSNVAGTVDFRIGAVSDSTNHHHNGDIAIAAHYTKALTSSEITAFYNATKTNFV